MEQQGATRQFVNELERRFLEVQEWAISHWPDPAHPLTPANFVEARKEILALGQAGGTPVAAPSGAEPADGGPQYESTAPAPWP